MSVGELLCQADTALQRDTRSALQPATNKRQICPCASISTPSPVPYTDATLPLSPFFLQSFFLQKKEIDGGSPHHFTHASKIAFPGTR